jgi:hypothetical protein
MGSAEFEWGALPKSLKRIRENKIEYVEFEFIFKNFEDTPIRVLCKESDKEILPKILVKLANKEIQLKEYCDLKESLRDYYNSSDFWWDIDNDFFFWKSDKEFDVDFKKALFETK